MKKIISLILVISMIFTLGGISLSADAYSLHDCPTTLGDLDGDGRVSAKDSLYIMQFAIKRTKYNDNQKKCADINGDNRITNVDSLLALRHSIGLPTSNIRFLKDVRTGKEFSAYAGKYTFASGAGNWYVTIDLKADGTFTGIYSDTNLGERGSGYDYTTYYNEFSGSFDGPHSTGKYTYGTYVKNFTVKYNAGSSEIKTTEYGQKQLFIYSVPPGISSGDSFTLYLAGTPASSLPDNFSWYTAQSVGDTLQKNAFYSSRSVFYPY